jgi:hypothetical protein
MKASLVSRSLLACTLLSVALPAAAAPIDQQKTANTANVSAEQQLCMRDAAFQRETQVMNATNAFYTRMQKTLEARRALVRGAWEQKDGQQRRGTLRAIWKKFGFTWKTESDEMRKGIRQAWNDYRTARANCKVGGYDDETAGLGMDSQF